MNAAIHTAVGDLNGASTEAGVCPGRQYLVRVLASNGECHVVCTKVPAVKNSSLSIRAVVLDCSFVRGHAQDCLRRLLQPDQTASLVHWHEESVNSENDI